VSGATERKAILDAWADEQIAARREAGQAAAEAAMAEHEGAEQVEAAVRAYEQARAEYTALQDRLVALLPDLCEFIESVHVARLRQEQTLRDAEKVAGHDLSAKTQTIATRAWLFDEPFRSVHDRWLECRKAEV
jgi:hypothetical protein